MPWITTLLGATRARILDLLRRSSASISELAERLGVSGNAVRGHVSALQRDGLVKTAGSSPSTGGKPALLYEISPDAEELYPKAYALVLSAVIEELRARYGQDATVELLREVGRGVAIQGARPASTLEQQVEAAAEVLRGLGADVSVQRLEDGWELRGVGCPLTSVVLEQPSTCSLAQALIEQVTSAPVVECCDRSGDRARCAFRVAEGAARPQSVSQ
ncbi:MAG TPA: helix-turn-helix domain-containing protein [Longimicrobiales bacterium]|nr:helix-turn-helix domain-containing protein [Longimicrobiales bacterium]